jgi:hypothetical protein
MTKATVIAPDAKLKDVFVNRLRELGHPNPEQPVAGTHEDQYSEGNQHLQQFHLNRTLRRYLGKFEQNTLAERTCLSDDNTPADWWYYMEKAVIPCIIHHDCPKMEAAATA